MPPSTNDDTTRYGTTPGGMQTPEKSLSKSTYQPQDESNSNLLANDDYKKSQEEWVDKIIEEEMSKVDQEMEFLKEEEERNKKIVEEEI